MPRHAPSQKMIFAVFTALLYSRAIYAVIVCPFACPSVWLSVCLFVRLSQVGVLPRRLNLGSHKQSYAIAQELHFSDTKNLGEIPTGSFPGGGKIEVG